MKKIILVRHAESSINLDIKDFNRPLNDRGLLDAKLMSTKVKKYIKSLDIIITSGANRALSTSRIFANNFDIKTCDILIDNNIYNSSVDYIMSSIYTIPNEYKTVMIFGHNPTFHTLSQLLTGESIYDFPTCSIFCVKFDTINWIDVNKGKKEFMIYPKSLK